MTASGDEQVRLTDEQRRPVETRLVSVALAAGAGCGKTTVLTERFLGEIDGANGRPLRALAAMTFTEKAARELRQRIRARCRAKLAARVDPGWWTLVLRALEAAPIGTFHEFCGRLLRSRADELGLDPEFAILDEIIADSLRERATASAIRRLLADRDPDLLSLGVDYGLRSTREMLEKILAQRTSEEIEPFCEATAEELVDRWRDGWTDWGRPSTLSKIGPAARRCRSALESLPAHLSPKLALVRQDVLDGLAALASPACSDDAVARLREAAKVATLRGKNDWPDADAKTLVGEVFKSLRAAIDGALKKMVWDEAATLEAAETTIRLARVAREVRRYYDDLKRQRQGLDFADLIAQTRAALRRAADARPVVAGGEADLDASVIEFILVDEFQDTDEIQSDILRLLGGEGFASGRLFVVGDSKQSIYRFRGAEPAIFGRWRGEFPEDGRPRLSENFRTVPRALHFVNALFAESFAEVGGAPGIAAADPEAIRLSAARPDHGDGPAVHFFWVEPPEATDDAPAAKPPSARECRVREAEALARWLRGRLDDGWPIADRKTGAPRPAHAGDVAFLLRAMTDVWPYETALADQGFDYHTIGGSAFYSQQEVLDIINLLSVVEDPLDELALAGTLRGPFFSLTDEGLYWLSRAPGGLIAGLQRADEVHGLSDGDRARAVRARRLLARWRDLKDHAPMASLLARALDESGFSAALVCEFLGDRKLANVRKLVRTAREFDRRGGFGLADFVGRLRAFADDPPSEEQAAVTEEDGRSVRIMTVHQAKGLEFPIVVLPDLNRNVGSRTSPFGFDRGLGLVVKPAGGSDDGESDGDGKSLGWLAHKAIEDREEREEALRLFYVATTRARDQLVLSAGFPKPLGALAVDKLSPALNLVWERFDGPTGRCLARLPDGWPAPEVAVVNIAAIDRAERRAARRPRPDLRAIISAIEAGGREVRSSSRSPASAPLPRFIDLDAPLRDPSRAGRIGALVRACAVDPGLLGGEPPEAVAARVGARQIPAANAGRIAEAAARLRAWVASPFFDRLPKTNLDKRVRGSQTWTWRASPEAGPVVRGSCDALVQADDGAWRPLVLLTPGEPEAWARARASLSLVAFSMKLGPAWLIRISPNGAIQPERRDRPTEDEIGRMLGFLNEWGR